MFRRGNTPPPVKYRPARESSESGEKDNTQRGNISPQNAEPCPHCDGTGVREKLPPMLSMRPVISVYADGRMVAVVSRKFKRLGGCLQVFWEGQYWPLQIRETPSSSGSSTEVELLIQLDEVEEDAEMGVRIYT